MVIIYTLLYIGMLLYTRTLNDLVSRVVSYVLVSYYMISIILCTLQLNDFFEVGLGSQLLFLLGTLSFWLGFIRCRINKKAEYIDRSYLEDSSKKMLSSIWLFLFIAGFCVFCIQFIPKAIMVAEMQGAAEMNDKDEVIFGGDSLITILYNMGMAIASNVAIALIAISIVTGLWKRYIYMFIACLFLQTCYVILSGGRGNVFSLVLTLGFVIVCFSANKTKIHIKKRYVIYASLLLISVFYVMTMVTNFRSHGEFKIEKTEQNEAGKSMALTFFNYTVVPVNLFDIAMKENYIDRLGGLQYGKATFIGVDYLVESLMKRVGVDYKTDLYIVDYLQENRKQCRKDGYYNYAYSMFFYNYMDFGILGILLFPFLFGYLIRYSIKRFYRVSSVPRLLLVVLMFTMMMTSHFTSPFIRPWDMLYLIILLLLDWYMSRSFANRRHSNNMAIKENVYS